ncbi:MAG: hypothetical protein JO246_04410 [Frankiaceae bacterium]|nr:hypothetical protein [Frankiaceae bacterium]
MTRGVRIAIASAVLVAVPACADGRDAATLKPFEPQSAPHKTVAINKAKWLHPLRKYYGVFSPNAPADMSSIDTIDQETGKQPNLSLYFQAWDESATTKTTNFSTGTASNACAKGMLPMYTWESWNTDAKGTNYHNGVSYGSGVLWTQKAFAPRKITAGNYDPYIRQTAKAIKSLGSHCPVALRFDQETNGYWYPWGSGNDGMGGTISSRAAAYVKMWRHVWHVFHHKGADNVIWVWSPNIQSLKHKSEPGMSEIYPGDKYVDWVGLDGYYYDAAAGTSNNQSFDDVFGATIKQLTPVASHKPWLVAETGVAKGTHKPAEIKDLIHTVADSKLFNGFVYFNQYKSNDRSDWRFDADQESLAAFKDAISSHVFANGKPGSF